MAPLLAVASRGAIHCDQLDSEKLPYPSWVLLSVTDRCTVLWTTACHCTNIGTIIGAGVAARIATCAKSVRKYAIRLSLRPGDGADIQIKVEIKFVADVRVQGLWCVHRTILSALMMPAEYLPLHGIRRNTHICLHRQRYSCVHSSSLA